MSVATMLMMMLVVVEELWITAVDRTPIITPTMGFFNTSDWVKTFENLKNERKYVYSA